jgi:hypothetical protein
MATLDRLSNELEVNDEIAIRGRVIAIHGIGDGQVLEVEWLTGPVPFLNFIAPATVEKKVSE